ncbi:hypothetical protein RND81_03G059700 [Saponaria officinalis]|uniref:Uncharacterized protein n=1 Tax=Saponaria officinalis TaxID=3572 RepID=A0AAW1M4A4_SAPOF
MTIKKLRNWTVNLISISLPSGGNASRGKFKSKTLFDFCIEVIISVCSRMVAHKFVEQSTESELRKQRENKSWWSFGWGSDSSQAETETLKFGDEDWERLSKIIGYKEGDEGQCLDVKKDVINIAFELYMRRNASKLMDADVCLDELACESLNSSNWTSSEA